MNYDETTPIPTASPAGPPISGETPTSVAPNELALAVGDWSKAMREVADEMKAAGKRAKLTLFLTGAAVATLLVGTYGIFATAKDVTRTAERVEGIAAEVKSIQEEQGEIKAQTKEASERAAEVAESAPRVEVVPATSASAGRPAKPAGLRLVIPSRPKASADAPPAPSASVVLPIPAPDSKGASTGGAP
jgi:hypothetical protein